MKKKRIIDISPLLSEQTAVFPGDQSFSREVTMDFAREDHLVLSSITSSVHVGAHADAPSHYHPKGESIEKRDLSLYMGPCQVMEIEGASGRRIVVEDLKGREVFCQRILFKTRSFPNPDHWSGEFSSLSPELIEFLADKGVVLVGIDTPSVDPETSSQLEAHQMIFTRDMAILEGLLLDHVEEGVYELIALPLKIKGGMPPLLGLFSWRLLSWRLLSWRLPPQRVSREEGLSSRGSL